MASTSPPSPPPPVTPIPPPPAVLRRLIDLDTAVSLRVYTLFQPIIPFPVLKSLEYSGDGRLFFPIILSGLLATTPLAALAACPKTPSTLLLINLLIGSLLDLLIIGLIKHLIQRPRPVYNKHMFLSFSVDHWSFPSGHSSRVFYIATFCFLYSNQVIEVLLLKYLKFDSESAIVRYFVVAVGLWAAITSISRVLLGRHFLLDVVAGGCLGVLEGVIVLRVLNCDNLNSWIAGH
ncbi:probable lipid phosphate phosphatase beta [Andrographis paniculata]|uniref:probable lipid phosphate phosphatase beta n=1 Tax=Andrographis paniculata TaxID=175694 RepID=UPI0021E7326C|nr:probable lipid phosphate phosphatase beta [Andrographis paniculata]XP_051130094.1 probable lipid phosphate phosphatase beta [Andrographis paniculata]XP_051130095.1 probable lipid phosphate phosphatase beta [Andrographis paniculata]XP_051130096.1 probable lipid phosphate phosphatase beta [Andrographis paniculata]